MTAPTTWTSLVVVFVKFVYGVVAVTALVTASAIVTAMLAAPLVYSEPTVQYTLGLVTIETLPEAVAVTSAGILAGLVSLHLLNRLATVGGLLTAALLAIGIDESIKDERADAIDAANTTGKSPSPDGTDEPARMMMGEESGSIDGDADPASTDGDDTETSGH